MYQYSILLKKIVLINQLFLLGIVVSNETSSKKILVWENYKHLKVNNWYEQETDIRLICVLI